MLLPPGVNPEDFSAALAQFAQVVGKEWLFTEPDDVDLYRDAYSPLWGKPEERRASAAVAPNTVEQVQKLVQIANRYKIPVYPISTGKNLGYGGSAPALSGSVVLDLKRMNRVLQVDDKRHFAIVEPGVSYFDLYNYIQQHGLGVWIDCPEPGWGSVMGNALDHGAGWTTGRFRDHFAAHCGLEIVLPSGELMRTGMGALPQSDTFGQFPYGFGPSVDGLFAQGNFGVVTKMGIWLMPEPEAYFFGTIRVPRRRDLIPLVEVVNRLEHSDLIGLPLYDSALAHLASAELTQLTGRLDVTDAELDLFAQRQNLPAWEVKLQFYGPAETVMANWAYAQRQVKSAISDATFEAGKLFRFPMPESEKKDVPFRVSIGVPNLEAFSQGPIRSRFNPHPFDGHLLFSPVMPKTGEAALEATRVFADIYAEQKKPGFNPLFNAPQAWLFRSFVMVAGFPVSRTDPAVNEASMQTFRKAVKLAADHGWGEYRTPPAFSDLVSSVYSFNEHALRRFIESLKDAADPNGIMSPGRCGIWPSRWRN